ncbi:nucleolar protein 16-like [Branchiostoma lanceolatum]|uniref:nucleolar protein 16-like n=1 Tax=Branchiostoma lanceolatum TaxID=7740 RepID=UPI0034524561
MAKNKKQRGRQKFDYAKDRKKQWKKSKKKVKIGHRGVEAAWDDRKSVSQNLRDMGLSHDVNKTIPLPKTRDMMAKVYQDKDEGMEVDVSPSGKSKKAKKLHVMKQLEQEANTPQEGIPRLSTEMVRYCTYMMDKYGEDYVAMARDVKNYYQDTPKQIRRKIMRFKSIPDQYQEYLKQKETLMSS